MIPLPDRLGRLQFFGWVAVGIIGLFAVGFIAGTIGVHFHQPDHLLHWMIDLVVLGWFIFFLCSLAPRRLLDMGWHPALTFTLLIPVVNSVFLVILLVTPTKYSET